MLVLPFLTLLLYLQCFDFVLYIYMFYNTITQKMTLWFQVMYQYFVCIRRKFRDQIQFLSKKKIFL